jgi:subtilisin-like proprotein convertase family protein
VSGLGSSISDVNVSVSGLSHRFPDDVGLLLVSPAGQSTLLMTDSGGPDGVSGINLTFDDSAPGTLPDQSQLSGGTYLPSRGTVGEFGCGAPVPFPDAPASPYGSSLSVINDTNPKGTWQLYVIDDSIFDAGTISGGWSLDISTQVPTTKADCKKGSWKAFGYPDQGTCITAFNENRS